MSMVRAENIVPNLTEVLAKELRGFYLFFEIYNRCSTRFCSVIMQVHQFKTGSHRTAYKERNALG